MNGRHYFSLISGGIFAYKTQKEISNTNYLSYETGKRHPDSGGWRFYFRSCFITHLK
jgi:hypothetical protein